MVTSPTETPDTFYIPIRNLPERTDVTNVTLSLSQALGDDFDVVYGTGKTGIETEPGVIDLEAIVITVRA